MSSTYKDRLIDNREKLIQRLQLDDVLKELFTSRAISRAEYDHLRRAVTNYGMVKGAFELITLLSKKDVTTYDCFLSVLRNTDQYDLVNVLEGSDTVSPQGSLTSKDIEVFRSAYEQFFARLKIDDTIKLLESTCDSSFWNEVKREEIKSINSRRERTRAFLDHVCNGTYFHLSLFIETLQATCQDKLAALLPLGVRGASNSGDSVNNESEVSVILTRVSVVSAQGYSLADDDSRTVCKSIVESLNNTSGDVRKKLTTNYELERLEAILLPKSPSKFDLNFHVRSSIIVEKIHAEIQSKNLGKVIKLYSHVSDHKRPYELDIDVREEELVRSDAAALSIPSVPVSKKREASLTIYRNMIHGMIDNKDYTNYDLYTSLRKHKGQKYMTSFELSDVDGVPLTHMCLDRGRLALLSVLLHLGWWSPLSRKKVSNSGSSLYKGMTLMEVAEFKRSRKSAEEVTMYTEWESSLSSIMKAARSGDYDRVKGLCSTLGEEVHYRDYNNGNALYWAIVSGDMRIFKVLLEKGGLDPLMRTRKNETLLHICALLGMSQFVPELIKLKVEPWFEDSHKKTALDRVAENGDVETLKAFLDCGVKPKACFPVFAAYSGRLHLLKFCLDNGHHEVDSKDQYRRTPMSRAIEGSRVGIVQYLLGKGAKLDILPTTNKSVLHVVAESGNVAIFDLILPELKKLKLFPKFLNSKDRYNGVELCFLIRGRDKGRDAWHYVEVARHRVPLFLKKTKSGNVDVAAFGTVVKSGWGVNPEQETIDFVEEMFRVRRLDETAEADCTPLHIAIFKGHTELALKLVEYGADVHIKDRFGLTPIMIASAKNLLDLVRELETKGAKVNETSNDGKSAADIANENENDTIVNYFSGRDIYRIVENFLSSDIKNLVAQLSRHRLDQIRGNGEDVQRHVIDTARDFKIDISQLLLDLGSGPILEASEDVAQAAAPGPSAAREPPGGFVSAPPVSSGGGGGGNSMFQSIDTHSTSMQPQQPSSTRQQPDWQRFSQPIIVDDDSRRDALVRSAGVNSLSMGSGDSNDSFSSVPSGSVHDAQQPSESQQQSTLRLN